MQAILYVGHGTRLKKGIQEALQFLNDTKSYIDVEIQETAFLELVEPDIVEGIAKCVARGATHVSIIPILLLTAQHAKVDIPVEVNKARARFPHLKLTVGRPFGVHEALIDTIYERIIEQRFQIDKEAEVLLIGRGSSDDTVVKDMEIISERLQEKFHFKAVKSCFLYGTGPSFEETITALKGLKPKQIFIVPYLLFPGLLSVSVEKKIKALDFNFDNVILCNSLGYNEKVRGVLVERVQEVI